MGHSEGPTNQQPTMAAVLKLDKVIQTVVATLVNIEELKPEQEKCTILFIKGKDITLLPMGFRKSLIYQLASLVAKWEVSNPI